MPRPIRSRRSSKWLLSLLLITLCFSTVPAQADDPTEGETDPVRLFERGQNAHSKGDLQRALALYEGALKLRPEFPEAEYQRGVALAALDRTPAAEAAFTHAIDLKKDWVLPISALGALLARGERDKEAEPFLRRAIQLGAKDVVTLDSLSAVRLRAGNKEEALTLARAGTDEDSENASAWAWRGAVERANGDTAAALTSLEHSLQLDPKYVAALNERAELRVQAGDYEHAISDLHAALAIKPKDKNISIRLAQVYQAAGKMNEAEAIYQSLGMTDSGVPPSGRGSDKLPQLIAGTREEIDAANSDDPAQARIALDKLVAKNPKNAALFARLGAVTRRTDPQKSADSYRHANEIDPTNPKYAIGYAAALVQLRRFTEAETILRRVIAAVPGEYTAHANLALALYELKRFAEAVTEYEWLAAARPEIAATYFFIATAHDNLGEYEQALDAYQKFLSRADPVSNKLDIEKVNLRLPRLRDQVSHGQGSKRKKP
jgi:tetratricopeptide (TPR) repeat protein